MTTTMMVMTIKMTETMKKNFSLFGLFAAVAVLFASCAKEVEVTKVKDAAAHVVKVTVSKDDISKTAVVEGESGASYVWTEGDEAYLHVYENGNEGVVSNVAYSADYKTATFTVTFTGNEADSYSYSAKYAKVISGSGNPQVQATQVPSATSFDPSADILISKATEDVTNLTVRATELVFTMGRIVAVNKMTLTGLVEGELVSKVEFTLETSFLGGYYTGSSYGSNVKTLTANYETPIAVGADGKFPVYFTCAPVDAAGITGVVVTTDQNVYTKSSSLEPNPFDGKTITFAVGTMKRFNMAMGGYGEPVSTGTPYTLVETQTDLCAGATYIIVGNNGGSLAAMGTQNNNNRAVVSVTANEKVINIDNTIAASTFTINSVTDGYTIQDNSNSYFLWAAGSTSNNYLRSRADYTDNKSAWTIAIDNGVATIENVGNTSRGVMCYNTGNSIISCYASLGSYKTLSLYVDKTTAIPSLATPEIVAEVQNTNDIYVIWTDVANAGSYLVTCTGQTDKTIDPGVEEATFTGLAEGTYTVTVTAISNDQTVYKNSAAATSGELLVGNPKGSTADNPYTASEARALALGGDTGSYYISGIVTKVQNQYSASYGTANFWLDENGSATDVFEGYKIKYFGNVEWVDGNAEIAVNDEVIIYGTLTIYNSIAETSSGYLVSLNGKTKGLTPGALTTTVDNENKQITVTWGAATGSSEAISYVVTCGTQSHNANAAGSHTFTMTDYGTYDVSVIASADDAISGTATTTATLSDPTSSTPEPVTINVFSNTATVTGSGEGQTATWTSGDITVTAVKTNSKATAFRSSDNDHTRFYSGWSLTVTSASNTIGSVVFNCTTDSYATALSALDFTNGTDSANSSTVTVSDVNASSTSTTLNAQVRIKSITVNYK